MPVDQLPIIRMFLQDWVKKWFLGSKNFERPVEAKVASNRRNKLHQTKYTIFGPSIYDRKEQNLGLSLAGAIYGTFLYR